MIQYTKTGGFSARLRPSYQKYVASEDKRRLIIEPPKPSFISRFFNSLTFLFKAAADTKLDVTNGSNLVYHATLYVGTGPTALALVPDTGSRNFLIEGNTCSNCFGTTYNPVSSTAYSVKDTDIQDKTYGSATFKAFEAYD